MINFERYPHVHDFISYYLNEFNELDVTAIMNYGVNNEQEAILLSRFIWKMVDKIHQDEINGISVLGNKNNIDILPDVSYEITNYMRKVGYLSVWDAITDSVI